MYFGVAQHRSYPVPVFCTCLLPYPISDEVYYQQALLVGTDASDLIIGTSQADVMQGDDASDLFVVAAKQGHDSIADFTKGVDLIGLSQGVSFNQLSFVNDQILCQGQPLATLTGIQTSSLTAKDFVQL